MNPDDVEVELKYPEHTKLRKIKEKSQAIGEFLEWLSDNGMRICKLLGAGGQYFPVYKGTNTLLAEYFEVDLNRLDNEKEQMLEEQRRLYETKGH